MSTSLVVNTAAGAVRGRQQGRIAAFYGLPYAEPPVGPARFVPPRPARPWTGIRDATVPGHIAPQPPSRLERVMGPLRSEGTQGEDCLSVNVWTPGPDNRARPVLVWLHGGGGSSGAGSAEWYAGQRLAERGDLVVVTINYRLGALGLLYLAEFADDLGAGNNALLDMIAALHWVRDNISAFGGDPTQVTLAGQSGGAASTVAIMVNPANAGLFQRAIVQSNPSALRPMDSAAATRVAELFLRAVELRPDQAYRLRDLSVAPILAGQVDVVRQTGGLAQIPPFGYVADNRVLPADPGKLVGAGAGPGVDMLIGRNRDEMKAFFAMDKRMSRMTRAAVIDAVRPWLGATAESQYAAYEPGTPSDIAAILVDQYMYPEDDPLVAARSATDNTVYVYQFDWRPDGSPFGCCHCLELPFVFGNPEAWREAPMLPINGPRVPAILLDGVQSAWISFIRNGNPNHDRLSHWPRHTVESTAVMHLDQHAGANTSHVEYLTN